MQEAISLVKGHIGDEESFEDRFEALRLQAGLSVSDFLDAVARYIAHEYAAGRLPYDLGDEIANYLWGVALMNESDAGEVEIPSYMYSVYDAFDCGEYRRPDDPPETDPAEKYARPAVEAIVARDNAA